MIRDTTELAEILALYAGLETLAKQQEQGTPAPQAGTPEYAHRGKNWDYVSSTPAPEGARTVQTASGKAWWQAGGGADTPQEESDKAVDDIDFSERLSVGVLTQEDIDTSSLKFPNTESVAGLIELGEQIPRYWSHVPPGTIGPSKEGGIQSYKISGGGGEAEIIRDKFKDGSNQKIIWLASPANPNDPYIVDASKLNLANVGSEHSGFQHAGDIPLEALVKMPKKSEQPQQSVGEEKESWEMTQEEFDESSDTVFHGTKAEFDRFKLIDDVTMQSDPGLVGSGVYFTPSKEQAEEFAKNPLYGHGDMPRVISARVGLKNPAIIQDGVLPDGRTLTEAHPRGITKESGKNVHEALKDAGYDGAIFQVSGGRRGESGESEITQVVTFDPTAIKTHRELVEQAMSEGKDVSDEVLRNYPDLAPAVQPQQAETEVAEKSDDKFVPEHNIRPPSFDVEGDSYAEYLGRVKYGDTQVKDIDIIDTHSSPEDLKEAVRTKEYEVLDGFHDGGDGHVYKVSGDKVELVSGLRTHYTRETGVTVWSKKVPDSIYTTPIFHRTDIPDIDVSDLQGGSGRSKHGGPNLYDGIYFTTHPDGPFGDRIIETRISPGAKVITVPSEAAASSLGMNTEELREEGVDVVLGRAKDGEYDELVVINSKVLSIKEEEDIQPQQAEEEVKKSNDLPEILTLLASVEYLYKQDESQWARFKDWTWELAEEKKRYHSDGRHTGSKGGTYDVIGYEVTAEGKPIGPGRVTGVAPPRGQVGLVGDEPSPSLQAIWSNRPVSPSQPNSLPQDVNDLVTLEEYSKGLIEVSKAELNQMVSDAYTQGLGTGALASTPIRPNIAVFSEDDKGQRSLDGVSTGDGHWVAARLMDPENPLKGGKQDIMINRNVDGKVQATSINKRGGKEVLYSWAWSANSERENHSKVARLIKSGIIGKIIKRMKSDIKNPKPVEGGPKGVEKTREAAAGAVVIGLTGRRPGNPKQASEVSVTEKYRKSKLTPPQAVSAVKDSKGIPQSSKIISKADILEFIKDPDGKIAKIQVRTFGVSTLQGRHVKDNGDGSVTLQFLGKAGKLNETTITDKAVAADLLSRKKKTKDTGQLFDITASGINAYIKALTGKAAGKGATAKNLRTLNATMMAQDIIASENIPTVVTIGDRQVSKIGVAEFEASVEYAEVKQIDKLKAIQKKAGLKETGFLSPVERENYIRDWIQRQQDKKKLNIVGEPVAEEIGNTAAMAIGEYINPDMFSDWDAYFQMEVEEIANKPTLSPKKEVSIRKRILKIAADRRQRAKAKAS